MICRLTFSLFVLGQLLFQIQGDSYGPLKVQSTVTADQALFDTSVSYRLDFDENLYVFTFPDTNQNAQSGGSTNPLDIASDPALYGTGVGQNLVTLAPCGLNQPHLHPRSTEVSHVVKGNLTFGLVEENGGRVVVRNILAGQSIFIPQGFLHYAQNFNDEEGQFIASFSDPDFGTLTISSNYFRFPPETIAVSLGVSIEEATRISQSAVAQDTLQAGPPGCFKPY